MAGEAKTSKFMLGTATVMLGAPEDLYSMTPATHSVGLVKNFRIQGKPGYTDLTQGVKGQKVFSVMTSNEVSASMEVYEYTAKNLTYSLGLEGYDVSATSASTTVSTAATANATSLVLAAVTSLSIGDWIMLDLGGENIVARKILTLSTVDKTITVAAIPQAVPKDTVVKKVSAIEIGSKEDQPFLAAKIVGSLADGTKVTVLCPKIRITNGFSLGFTTDNFDNLPYEFSFYDLTASDSLYADFQNSQARLLV